MTWVLVVATIYGLISAVISTAAFMTWLEPLSRNAALVKAERRTAARWVLLSPIWPLPAGTAFFKTLTRLVRDAEIKEMFR